jgi:hypothetical protein
MFRSLLLLLLLSGVAGCMPSGFKLTGGEPLAWSFRDIAPGEVLTATRTVEGVISGGNFVNHWQIELDGVVIAEMPATEDHYEFDRTIPVVLNIAQLAAGSHTLYGVVDTSDGWDDHGDDETVNFTVQK